MRKPRLIVTGANGFLGTHITRYFAERHYPVLALVNKPALYLTKEIRQKMIPQLTSAELSQLFQDYVPNCIIHCAGSSSVPDSILDPYTDYQKSVGLTAYLIAEIVKSKGKCKFIYLSSAAVYGNPETLPIREYDRVSPISPYGVHKLLGEQLVRQYSGMYAIDYTVLRVFSGYGEFLKKQVVADLFQKFMDPELSEVSVIGTGNETRDFIHGEDVARAVECMLSAEAGCYNVASGKQTTIKEIVSLIQSITGIWKPVAYSQEKRIGDPAFWQADISKLVTSGFQTTIDLKAGIERYWNWVRGQSSQWSPR